MTDATTPDPPAPGPLRPLIHWWHRAPLYWRIIAALALGIGVGIVLGPLAPRLGISGTITTNLLSFFGTFSRLILRLLGALAPPLIMIAVLQALMQAQLKGGIAGKMIYLLILNTVVAILIGLFVANIIRPGRHASLRPKEPERLSDRASNAREKEILQTLERYNFKPVADAKKDPLSQFLDNIPESLLRPLVDNNVIGVIFVAVAFGIALRRSGSRNIATASDLVALAFDSILIVLHWIIDLVPIGVFGIVAKIVGTEGFAPFKSLAWFVLAVLLGLLLQACYYLIRIRFGSWVRPAELLRGTRDALVMAFSTGSSTATMPVTFDRLWRRVGLREESAS